MTQIKRLLSRGVFTIILCSVAACSNDDNENIEEIKDASYTLDEIEWKFDNDGIKVTEIEIPEEIYKNPSNSEMLVTVCSVENFMQTSQFYSDDPKYFQLLVQSPIIEVCIPSGEIPFDDFFHTSGGPEVPFLLEEYTYSPHSYSTNTSKLPPHSILKFNATVIKRNVTAIYRARFIGNDSGKQVEITGKWHGVYYDSLEDIIKIEEIK